MAREGRFAMKTGLFIIILSLCMGWCIPSLAMTPQQYLHGYTTTGPVFTTDFLSGKLDSRLTFVRNGNATMFDSTGRMVWADANMFLNSATLATQSVAVVVGQSYTMSAYGTGSASLSDGASGTWTGIGANDRVSLAFTATTTTATFTVTGSVTSAQLEPTSYNSPHPYHETTTAPYYGPRFDYDPATLAPRGLLYEPQGTNKLLYTNLANAYYSKSGLTAESDTTNEVLAPDGSATVYKAIATTGSGAHNITRTSALAGNNQSTFSVYAKKPSGGTRDYVRVQITTGTGNNTAYFNVATGELLGGTVSSGSTNVLRSITAAGDGFYRVSLSLISSSSTNLFVAVGMCTSSGGEVFAGSADGSDKMYFWGPQLEIGYGETSLIPTTGASATRAADSLYTTSIPWFNATQGTFVAEFALEGIPPSGTNPRIVNFSDNTAANSIQSLIVIGTKKYGGSIVVASTGHDSGQTLSASVGTTAKVGIVYIAGANLFAADGVLDSAGTFGASGIPSGITKLCLMNRYDDGAPANGHLRSFKYWNRALSSSELQKVTTP